MLENTCQVKRMTTHGSEGKRRETKGRKRRKEKRGRNGEERSEEERGRRLREEKIFGEEVFGEFGGFGESLVPLTLDEESDFLQREAIFRANNSVFILRLRPAPREKFF